MRLELQYPASLVLGYAVGCVLDYVVTPSAKQGVIRPLNSRIRTCSLCLDASTDESSSETPKRAKIEIECRREEWIADILSATQRQ